MGSGQTQDTRSERRPQPAPVAGAKPASPATIDEETRRRLLSELEVGELLTEDFLKNFVQTSGE